MTDWSKVIEQFDPQASYNKFFEIFNAEFDRCCPIVKTKSKNRRTLPRNPWITPGLMISRRTKEKLLKDKIHNKTSEAKEKFYSYNRIYKKVIKKSKEFYYAQEFGAAKGDSKKNVEPP